MTKKRQNVVNYMTWEFARIIQNKDGNNGKQWVRILVNIARYNTILQQLYLKSNTQEN